MTIDPELEKKWTNIRIGIGILFGAAGAIALGERLRGDPEKELGSYYTSVKRLLAQRKEIIADPAAFLIELPEHRSITRWVASAVETVGIPIHQPNDRLPPAMPSFVNAIRTFRFHGVRNFCYEEIDISLDGTTRTISTLTGPVNALGLYNSFEKDRALRILSNLELGAQAMQRNGLIYSPPDATTTALVP